MRINLDKKHFTRSERKFGRMLQELHIPFETKILINGRETDFLIKRYAIDIDGHPQNTDKNVYLAKAGYIPLHFYNKEINQTIINKLINL